MSQTSFTPGEISSIISIVATGIGIVWRMNSFTRSIDAKFADIMVRLGTLEERTKTAGSDHDEVVRMDERVKKNSKDIQNQWGVLKDVTGYDKRDRT